MSGLNDEKYSEELREHLMGLKTSIRAVIDVPTGGRIMTMGFPGLSFDERGKGYIDLDRMLATLDQAAKDDCAILLILLEEKELPAESLRLLEAETSRKMIKMLHLPIVDYQAPSEQFERTWEDLQKTIQDILRCGGTVGFSCHYGAGRSGTIAAGLLLETGLDLSSAVVELRRRFPDSIESDAQMQWLEAKAAGLTQL